MNTNIVRIFENTRLGRVRILIKGEEDYWFCLADVCDVLGIGNPSQLLTRLESGGVITSEVSTFGNNQHGTPFEKNVFMTFINESNLYATIFQSRKPQAKEFQNWVFNEVLPSIRRTGMYMNTNLYEVIKRDKNIFSDLLKSTLYLVDRVDVLEEELEKANTTIAKLEPSANKFNEWLHLDELHTVRMAGYIMGIKGMGLKNLFKYFRENGYVNSKNLAFVQYQNQGLFVVQRIESLKRNGKTYSRYQTMMTNRGIDFFRDKLLAEGRISIHQASMNFRGETEPVISDLIEDIA